MSLISGTYIKNVGVCAIPAVDLCVWVFNVYSRNQRQASEIPLDFVKTVAGFLRQKKGHRTFTLETIRVYHWRLTTPAKIEKLILSALVMETRMC